MPTDSGRIKLALDALVDAEAHAASGKARSKLSEAASKASEAEQEEARVRRDVLPYLDSRGQMPGQTEQHQSLQRPKKRKSIVGRLFGRGGDDAPRGRNERM